MKKFHSSNEKGRKKTSGQIKTVNFMQSQALLVQHPEYHWALKDEQCFGMAWEDAVIYRP